MKKFSKLIFHKITQIESAFLKNWIFAIWQILRLSLILGLSIESNDCANMNVPNYKIISSSKKSIKWCNQIVRKYYLNCKYLHSYSDLVGQYWLPFSYVTWQWYTPCYCTLSKNTNFIICQTQKLIYKIKYLHWLKHNLHMWRMLIIIGWMFFVQRKTYSLNIFNKSKSLFQITTITGKNSV